VFDSVTKNLVVLSHLGDIGYKLLLSLNRVYNRFRAWRGKEYFSLSKAIKAKVKSAVNYISKFEQRIAGLARARGCAGVICGHIHTPEIRMIGGTEYLNSGDWVESLTAIVEHFDGRFELIHFKSFCEDVPFETEPDEAESGDLETPALAESVS
jgi:UDP-2,3-diacylglucosamine pyrophosphatase LpxH